MLTAEGAKTYLPLDQCKAGVVYYIHARNFTLGIFDGRTGFIGVRQKFGNTYLFTEFHYDADPHFGTVQPLVALDLRAPAMTLSPDLNTQCSVCHALAPEESVDDNWTHLDGTPKCEGAHRYIKHNEALLAWLRPYDAVAQVVDRAAADFWRQYLTDQGT